MPKDVEDYTVMRGTFLHENLIFQIPNWSSWVFAKETIFHAVIGLQLCRLFQMNNSDGTILLT
jgi:hypothetical protein